MNDSTLEALIRRARAGDAEALDRLLQRMRPYVHRMADRRIGGRLASRVDASDVVQETLLDASQGIRQFLGSTEPELAAWLKGVLENNIADVIRRNLVAQKRAMANEQPLDKSDSQGQMMRDNLAAQTSTPSQRAMRGEQAVKLSQLLEKLPEGQREPVRLRYIEGMKLQEIAEKLDCSSQAVAKRLERAMKALRQLFKEDSQETA